MSTKNYQWFNPLREENWQLCEMPVLGYMLFVDEECVATGDVATKMWSDERARVEMRYAIQKAKNFEAHESFKKWLEK